MKKSLTFVSLLSAAAAISIISATALTDSSATTVRAEPLASYRCASIHFGMEDSDLSGYIATYGNTYTEAKSPYATLGYATGIDILSFSVTGANAQWLDEGTKYTVSKVTHTSDKVHGLKLGTSSKNTTLKYTFAQNIIGCDIYAIGWNDTGITLSVNSSESIGIEKNADVSGTFADKEISYTKYHFDFESTDSLEIASTKRLFIGDIALRVEQ